jgi:pre-mRNA-splicing factor 38A
MSDRYITDRGLVQGVSAVHNLNPTLLIEKIIRERIQDSVYWKEQCFGLTAATLCDRAVDLKSIGGQYGNQRIAPFLCLVFKLIQLQPEEEIILEYLNQKDFKYLRAIAAFYIRLFYKSEDIYKLLEPLLNDYRKLRIRTTGGVHLTYMDEFVDSLLNELRVCDTALPRLTKRVVLEDSELLDPRTSELQSEFEEELEREEEE